MPAFLKHLPTGDVYPFNADMQRRGDMEPCDAQGAPIIEVPDEPTPVQPPLPTIPTAPRRGRPPKMAPRGVDAALLGDDNEFSVT